MAVIMLTMIMLLLIAGCADNEADLNDVSITELIAGAMEEGQLYSLAMPDEWANWRETWNDLELLYGIEHQDDDMSSVDELGKFAEGIGDIGDVGCEYGPDAEEQGLTLKYKTSYWDEIPDWAKDKDGDWMVCYTGTLAFLILDEVVGEEAASTWGDVMKGTYPVAISDVPNSTLGQYTVYVAALACGGTSDNLQPGIDYFKRLAEQGRLIHNVQGLDEVAASGAGVNIRWDYIALQYRDEARELPKPLYYSALIPDISVTVGYASIINRKAEHPYAAALAREYILSNEGQINLARGYATPIRSIRLPADIESQRIPPVQYNDDMIAIALAYDSDTAQSIVTAWNEQIMPILNGGY